jgi:anti-sigma regulatory factor (Ser/Thr protein kinase)
VVLHGYGQQPGHPIVIRFHVEEEHVAFAVEDKAPPFNPLKSIQYAGAARPVSLEFVEPGGNGIRLMRRFAGSIGYERLEDGNRVTMRFPIRPAAVDL